MAAADPRDPDPVASAQLLSSHERLVPPAPVLVEVDHHLRGSRSWFRLLEDIQRGALEVEDLMTDDYHRVGELMSVYADLGVGFVDCGVLAIVERRGAHELATLDRRHSR